MKLKIFATAVAITLSLGGAAFASDATELGNPGMLLYGNGAEVSVTPGSRTERMIMKHATPYRGMIYSKGGRVYMLHNAKMPDGRMLYDSMPRGKTERH